MVLKEIQLVFGFHSLVPLIYRTVPKKNNVPLRGSEGVSMWTFSLLPYSNDIKIIKAVAASQ
jgi:hypothetical protein